jgi:hypothetical protein
MSLTKEHKQWILEVPRKSLEPMSTREGEGRDWAAEASHELAFPMDVRV